jgi:hypothetical protein
LTSYKFEGDSKLEENLKKISNKQQTRKTKNLKCVFFKGKSIVNLFCLEELLATMNEPLIDDASPNEIRSPLTVRTDADSHGNNQQPMASPAIGETNSTGSPGWVKDFAGQYDFCVVLPAENGEPTQRGRGYLETLHHLGFETFIYKNLRAEKEIFILLRAPLEKLRAVADNLDFVMLLDPSEVTQQLADGDKEAGIGPVVIPDNAAVTPYPHNQYIYGQYSRQINERLYWKEPGWKHPFRELVRLKLCAIILETRPAPNKENLKIVRYLRNRWMLGCFPLHDRAKTEMIDYKMKFYPMQAVPLDDLKEYFGEKITLYFGFTEHYTNWLITPAIIGIPLQIAVFVMNDYNAPFLPFFAVFICLWAIFMLEVRAIYCCFFLSRSFYLIFIFIFIPLFFTFSSSGKERKKVSQ